MADFDSLFGEHCALLKRLESRWWYERSKSSRHSRSAALGHRMPFLRRNLSYVHSPPSPPPPAAVAAREEADGRKKRARRGGGGLPDRRGRRKRRKTATTNAEAGQPPQRRWRGRTVSNDAVWEILSASRAPPPTHHRPPNLLLKCFKHACHNVNPALQASPGRSTRAMLKRDAGAGAGAVTPEAAEGGGGSVTTPKDEFLSRQSSAEKVVRDVELASDTGVEVKTTTTARRALVLTEPRLMRAARQAKKEEEETKEVEEEEKDDGEGTSAVDAAEKKSLGGNKKGGVTVSGGDVDDLLPSITVAPYAPLGKDGRLVPPRPPRGAYHLFALSERDAVRRSLPRGPDRKDKAKVERRLKRIWKKLSSPEVTRYIRGSKRDKRRYEEEMEVYKEAVKRKKEEREEKEREADKADESESENGVAGSSLHGNSENGDASFGHSAAAKKWKVKDKSQSPVCFHFPYLDPEAGGAPAAQVEVRRDRRCPICFFRYGTIQGLMFHGKTFHAPGVTFKPMDNEGDMLHIRVEGTVDVAKRQNSLPPSTYAGSVGSSGVIHVRSRPLPSNGSTETEDSLRKDSDNLGLDDGQVPTVPIPVSASCDGTSEDAAVTDEEKQQQQRCLPPRRKYYHSRTNLPLHPADWSHDCSDSDDEPDDTWLHRMGEELMDDFDDVSHDEKVFMNAWNRFMKRHTVTGDRHVPALCVEFVRTRGTWLVGRGLRQNLLCHLFVMWDDGVVSSDHVLKIMSEYDKVAALEDDGEGMGDVVEVGDAVSQHVVEDASGSATLRRKISLD